MILGLIFLVCQALAALGLGVILMGGLVCVLGVFVQGEDVAAFAAEPGDEDDGIDQEARLIAEPGSKLYGVITEGIRGAGWYGGGDGIKNGKEL